MADSNPTKRQRGQLVPCRTCGKMLHREPKQIATRKTFYCDHACHNAARTAVACAHCGAILMRTLNQIATSQNGRFFCGWKCSRPFRLTIRGAKDRHWSGGRGPHANGYIRVNVGREHPMADRVGYALEHRIVMANHLGRALADKEVVHHINHKRGDNRIENLQLLPSQSAHRTLHNPPERTHCTICGIAHHKEGLCREHFYEKKRRLRNAWRKRTGRH